MYDGSRLLIDSSTGQNKVVNVVERWWFRFITLFVWG